MAKTKSPKRRKPAKRRAPKRQPKRKQVRKPVQRRARLPARWADLPGLDTISDHTGDTNGRTLPGKTLRDTLAAIDQMAPRRDRLGHLYRTQDQQRKHTKRATLFLYIKSDENTYAIHETIFSSNRLTPRGAKEWRAWMQEHVFKGTHDNDDIPAIREGILKGAIIPGIQTKSGKFWTVKRNLGFMTHDLSKSERPKVVKTRHKAKPQGKQNRQGNRRRRHRNTKR